jgi:hypothetical protein
VAGKTKSPLILWHLLSLDAPTVATVWVWFIARVNHISLRVTSLIAMTAAVWTLYAADRLLDAQGATNDGLEARHYFHQRHRPAFMAGIAVCSVLLAALLPRIPEQAIRLYLILGGLVFGYFVIIHATHSAHRLPKEIAVGICFAAATFIPTVARRPELRLLLLPPALLLAALCSLNCLFIYAWEHPGGAGQRPHPVTAAALARLNGLAAAIFTLCAGFAWFDHGALWPLYGAVAASTVALGGLNLTRGRMSVLSLRAAADLVLLTPLLLVFFL